MEIKDRSQISSKVSYTIFLGLSLTPPMQNVAEKMKSSWPCFSDKEPPFILLQQEKRYYIGHHLPEEEMDTASIKKFVEKLEHRLRLLFPEENMNSDSFFFIPRFFVS